MGSPIQGGQEGPSGEGMEAPLFGSPPIPSQRALNHERGGEQVGGRGLGSGLRKQGGWRMWESHPSSLPTQQLAQMAAEDGSSTLGQEEPARRKLQLAMGGKAPKKNSSRLVS